MRKIRCFILCCILFSLCLYTAFSQDFYWETPASVSRAYSCFPSFARATPTGSKNIVVWQEISNNQIWISAYIYRLNGSEYEWVKNERFAGPFPYSGEIPQISTVAMNKQGKIACAVIADAHTISVFTSDDDGRTFTKTNVPHQGEPLLAPRIYSTSRDGFIVFASVGREESFILKYAKSSDGYSWENFASFEPTTTMINPFIPVLAQTPEGDVVVFQASHSTGTRLSYQLYSSLSTDGGTTWSPPNLLTNESQNSIGENLQVFTNYHNQRANLLTFNNKTYIAWEKTHYASENASIYFSEMRNHKTLGNIERISGAQGNASNPILFVYNNNVSLIWFDTRRGSENVYFTQKKGLIWTDDTRLSSGASSNLFGIPVVSNKASQLEFFWEERTKNTSGIIKQKAVFR